MKKDILEKRISPVYLSITKRGETIRIPVDDIIYIESNARKLIIHTSDGEYEYIDKMKNVADLLEREGFVRCHQSYLVRISSIKKLRFDELDLGGIVIRISRKYRDSVREAVGNLLKDSENKAFLSGDVDEEDTVGVIVCTSGPYTGKTWKVVPQQEIMIGRNGNESDIVINLPKISRVHLSIAFYPSKNIYEIMDMSSNGTYFGDDIRLEKGQRYEIERGEKIKLGDKVTTLKLA